MISQDFFWNGNPLKKRFESLQITQLMIINYKL
jgi:hypothetical protein